MPEGQLQILSPRFDVHIVLLCKSYVCPLAIFNCPLTSSPGFKGPLAEICILYYLDDIWIIWSEYPIHWVMSIRQVCNYVLDCFSMNPCHPQRQPWIGLCYSCLLWTDHNKQHVRRWEYSQVYLVPKNPRLKAINDWFCNQLIWNHMQWVKRGAELSTNPHIVASWFRWKRKSLWTKTPSV